MFKIDPGVLSLTLNPDPAMPVILQDPTVPTKVSIDSAITYPLSR